MKGIILVGHGHFASGLTSSVKLLAGKPDNFLYHDFLEGMSQEDLEEKITQSIQQLSKCDEIVLVTDIVGGTPFKISVLLSLANPQIEVVTGINLPMLLTLTLMLDNDTKSLAASLDELITESKENMIRVEKSKIAI